MVRHGAMLAAALVAATTAPDRCGAADWSISPFASQGLSAVGGFGDDGEDGVRSTTSLGATVTARTKTTVWSLSPGATVSLRSGDDEDSSVNFRLRGGVTHVGPRLDLDASALVEPRFLSDRDFEAIFDDSAPGDPVLVGTRTRDVDPLQILINLGAGARYRLDTLNAVSARAFVLAREYDQTTDNLQPSQTVGGSLSWTRTLDARSNASLSGSVRRFMSDSASQEDSTSYGLSVGGSRRLTPRHDATMSLGATAVDGDDDFAVRFSGDASLGYRTAQTTARIGLSQSVAQDDFGEVSTITALTGSVSRRIDNTSSFEIGGRLASETPVFGGSESDDLVATVTPRYRLALTDSWSLVLGYGFRGEYEDGSISGSNRLFLQISTGFDSPL